MSAQEPKRWSDSTQKQIDKTLEMGEDLVNLCDAELVAGKLCEFRKVNADLRAQLRYLFYYRFTLGDKMEDQLREREPERCRQIYDLLKE